MKTPKQVYIIVFDQFQKGCAIPASLNRIDENDTCYISWLEATGYKTGICNKTHIEHSDRTRRHNILYTNITKD